jgi:hypothetical protein
MIADPVRNSRALESLISAVATRQAIGVTGAGLSWWAGYSTWQELIDRLADAVRQRRGSEVDANAILANNANPLYCAQQLGREMGPRSAFEDFIRGEFSPVLPRDSRVLTAFARIPFRHVLTLNFEESLERTYTAVGVRFGSMSSASDHSLLTFLRTIDEPNGDLQVVHLHGKASDPHGDITLTEEEYAELYRVGHLFQKLLWLLAASRTLVFFGFGFNDSDFLWSLRETARDIRALGTCHYALVGLRPNERDQERRTSLNNTYLIEPIFYDVGINGDGHDHDGFVAVIQRIADALEVSDAIAAAPLPAPSELVPSADDLAVVEQLGEQFVERVDPGGDDVPR